MSRPLHIIVTGSSGFLGSRLVDKLVKSGHNVCGIDIREPSRNLLSLGSNVYFSKTNISDYSALQSIVNTRAKAKPIDFIVHLAAFWKYQLTNYDMYHKTNIIGTKNIINISNINKVKRLIFASSITALPLIKDTDAYTEKTLVDFNVDHPYGKSKAIGESLLRDSRSNAILRLTGVYSDWCELPPLAWLINRWSSDTLLGRIVPGTGNSGMSYLHRDDFVSLVENIIAKHEQLNEKEIFMGCPTGVTLHNELFKIIRSKLGLSVEPFYVPKTFVKMGLGLQTIISKPSEQLWMCDYIDHPLRTDSSYTQSLLEWKPSSIIDNLPTILENWKLSLSKQMKRENHNYEY